jgi:transposase
MNLTREQFDWLVAGLPWQRLAAPQPKAITQV